MQIQEQILHYPNLKTVLEVEKVLKEADTLLNKEQIKARLPAKIMHQTLNVILGYLEGSGKILVSPKGILWTYNDNQKFKKLKKYTKSRQL